MNKRGPQAKDVDEAQLLAVVAFDATKYPNIGACIWRVQGFLSYWYPEKVVSAKVRRLIAKGVLNGCACGCRGDLTFR